jgi:RNA polymerase sigma-70 factor (ECF subfamily)
MTRFAGHRNPLYEQTLADLTQQLRADRTEALAGVILLLGGVTEGRIRQRLGKALDDGDYQDAMSLALTRLWFRRESFDPARGRLDRWFYVLARNAALDLKRRRKVRPELPTEDLDVFPAHDTADPDDTESSLLRDLRGALTQLSDKERRILLSRLPDKELSLELGIAPGTIRVTRLRSKDKLRATLRGLGRSARG